MSEADGTSSGSDPVRVDLSRPQRIHLVGIGGAGMSAIAAVLAAMGHGVSGSDLISSVGLERVRALGVRVNIGHDANNLSDAEVVAVSTAIPSRNPEVAEARERGLPVLSRAAILAAITRQRRTVAVAGTHGKTTTSAMLALVMLEAGWTPSFIIGGDLNEIGTGAAWTSGDWLVVEADESDGTFLELDAEAVVVTSVEADHLDHYLTFDNLVDAFDRFLARVPGPRVVSVDQKVVAQVADRASAHTFGSDAKAEYRIHGLVPSRFGSSFRLIRDAKVEAALELSVPGPHNAANAAAAAVMALRLGIGREAIESGLALFTGVARRFQLRGEAGGVTYVDDYAHLPGEVMPVLEAARQGGWRRIVCVFQPHRYGRTAALWRDFAGAFGGADLLVITDVYAAGETPMPGISGKLILDAVLDADPSTKAAYLPGRSELISYLRRTLRSGDLCLTLGAGDLTLLPDQLMASSP